MTCNAANRAAFSLWFIRSSWFDRALDAQIRHILDVRSAEGRPKRPTRIGLALPSYLSIERMGQPLSIDRQCLTVFQAAHCVSISHSTQRVGDVLKLLSGSRACKPPRLKASYLNSGHGRETDLTSRDCRDLSAAMSNANPGCHRARSAKVAYTKSDRHTRSIDRLYEIKLLVQSNLVEHI